MEQKPSGRVPMPSLKKHVSWFLTVGLFFIPTLSPESHGQDGSNRLAD
jgi:hypothetical protein